MSTLYLPDIIHVIGVPRLFPFFTLFRFHDILYNVNQEQKKQRVGLEMKLDAYVTLTFMCILNCSALQQLNGLMTVIACLRAVCLSMTSCLGCFGRLVGANFHCYIQEHSLRSDGCCLRIQGESQAT